MGKEVAKDWLKSAKMDIKNIEYIINDEDLTPIASFHAHQIIEKSLKAYLEFKNQKIPKTHDLLLLSKKCGINFDEDILDKMNELYIESRYPGDFGLMPYGKPTIKDTLEFFNFAKEVFKKIEKIIKGDNGV